MNWKGTAISFWFGTPRLRTAYAHASELMVKRRRHDQARPDHCIKSGQSGEVGSPQLHFEIRKGSSPVDPLQIPERGVSEIRGRSIPNGPKT